MLQNKSYINQFTVTYTDIISAIHKITTCKRDGITGLTSDYFIHACDEFLVHLN